MRADATTINPITLADPPNWNWPSTGRIFYIRYAFAMAVLAYVKELRERLPEILGLLNELAQQRSGLEYLETVLRYISRSVDTLKPDELRQVVTQTLTRGDEIMSTIAEQWIQQGIQQGISQGEMLVLKRQLERRFGALPDWVEEKLITANQASLELWADQVLEAKRLEDVFDKD